MDIYAGRPVTTIKTGQISDSDREKFNSFATRIPGPAAHGGKFRGLVGCADSDAGHPDCAFGYEVDRDTHEDAMADAASLMHELRPAGAD